MNFNCNVFTKTIRKNSDSNSRTCKIKIYYVELKPLQGSPPKAKSFLKELLLPSGPTNNDVTRIIDNWTFSNSDFLRNMRLPTTQVKEGLQSNCMWLLVMSGISDSYFRGRWFINVFVLLNFVYSTKGFESLPHGETSVCHFLSPMLPCAHLMGSYLTSSRTSVHYLFF